MIFMIIWILLIGYAVFFAAGRGNTSDPVLSEVFQANWAAIDPLVLTVFNSLGIFPLVFLTLLLRNDRMRWPAWPFLLVSFGLGAFSLLPYFALGNRPPERKLRTPAWLLNILQSKTWLAFLILVTIANLITLQNGISLEAYMDAFKKSHLVSVMTVDWFILWGLSIYAVYHFYPEARMKPLAFLPILGPPLVLLFNPRMKEV
ncbi:hypothetical protein ACFO0S_07845 [Chryseomicrobium palamuruense]|uniref:DUF2834 domain-containing protein n=1 Tax=Chryseomicrobium palamuruense TaxID=682973 RepID=A0ABV8UVW3_9BACL